MPMPSTCSGAGVREAPRHEIAGCGAATGQRALWGFDRGVRLEEFGSKRPTRSRCVKAWAYVQGGEGVTDTNGSKPHDTLAALATLNAASMPSFTPSKALATAPTKSALKCRLGVQYHYEGSDE